MVYPNTGTIFQKLVGSGLYDPSCSLRCLCGVTPPYSHPCGRSYCSQPGVADDAQRRGNSEGRRDFGVAAATAAIVTSRK
jgi:hypothetical protein